MKNEVKNVEEKSTNKTPQNNNRKNIILATSAALLIFVVILITVFATLFWQENKIEQSENGYEIKISELQDRVDQIKPPAISVDELIEDKDETESDNSIKLETIYVDWEDDLIETTELCREYSRCFLAGTIINDDPRYKRKTFYLELTPTMGGSSVSYFILRSSSGVIIREYVEGGYGEDTEARIVGINDVPEEINFPGSWYKLKKYNYPSGLFVDVALEKKLFVHSVLGDVFLSESGCVVAELPDHTAIAYDFITPFLDGESRVPNITFFDGKKNEDEYDYTVMTCGGDCLYLKVAPEDMTESDLEVVGQTVNGDKVYGLKDTNDKRLKDLYNDENTYAHLGYASDGGEMKKYSYEEFIQLNPYLFWKDPIGRLIQFTNSKYAIAAEMCKPVIYLYPEDKMSLNIEVNVRGGLTHTDPEYNDGWRVEASPNSEIKNLDTGEYYDSLLWEGIGLNYPPQEKGWVVKQGDLDSFFDEKLARLGLNKKETNDFKEYWLSRLNEKLYYRISFLSQRQFSDLATVEFSPVEPKVFIRVMMTASGLDEYMEIPEQFIPNAPKRSGFTVVEWGGALLK
ncbi:hypothetical protein KJ937_02135 [Patescibacteria group bacterium]|nr:hypothetical protein [Patescibacteria group bacterium]